MCFFSLDLIIDVVIVNDKHRPSHVFFNITGAKNYIPMKHGLRVPNWLSTARFSSLSSDIFGDLCGSDHERLSLQPASGATIPNDVAGGQDAVSKVAWVVMRAVVFVYVSPPLVLSIHTILHFTFFPCSLHCS